MPDQISLAILKNEYENFLQLTACKKNINFTHLYLLFKENKLDWVMNTKLGTPNIFGISHQEWMSFIFGTDQVKCLKHIVPQHSVYDLFYYCIYHNATKCLQFLKPLVSNIQNVSIKYKNPLIDAVVRGCNLETIRFLIEECNCKVNDIYIKKHTCLSMAFNFCSLDVIKYLIVKQHCKITCLCVGNLTTREEQEILKWIPSLENLTLFRTYETRHRISKQTKTNNFFHYQLQLLDELFTCLQFFIIPTLIENIIFGYLNINSRLKEGIKMGF